MTGVTESTRSITGVSSTYSHKRIELLPFKVLFDSYENNVRIISYLKRITGKKFNNLRIE